MPKNKPEELPDASKVGAINFRYAPPSAFEVAKARQTLAEAEQAEREASRATLLASLKVVREQLAIKRPMLATLSSRVMQLRAQGENLDRAIRLREEDVSQLMSERSDIVDYLPDDPDALSWTRAVEQKRAEITQLREAGLELPNLCQLQLEGVTLQNEILQLEHAQTSILNRLGPARGSAWGGKLLDDGLHTAF
jgi:chromosome segregation ATPase